MAWKSLTGFDASNQNVVNVADPTQNTHAANKQYVDGVARGLRWKESVVAASTATVVIATALENGDSLDGVTLVTGDRVLLKDQSTASENGIYIVAASGAASRAADLAATSDAKGIAITVTSGSVNNDRVYIQTEVPAVVGTNDLSFSQLGGGGTTYSADGNGIEESGTVFSLELATNSALSKSSSGLTVASSIAGNALTWTNGVLDVAPGTGLEISSDTLRIAAAAAGAGLTGGAGSALAVGQGATYGGVTVNADDIDINPSVVVRKYATNVPNGSTTAVITHNLNTRDITWALYEIGTTTYADMVCDAVRTDANTLTLTFAVAPTSGQYRVVVHG
jgi:hypothetical protein